jgi:hypothetical protein
MGLVAVQFQSCHKKLHEIVVILVLFSDPILGVLIESNGVNVQL